MTEGSADTDPAVVRTDDGPGNCDLACEDREPKTTENKKALGKLAD